MKKYPSAESDPSSQTELRRQLRSHATTAEATLWRLLRNDGAGGYKFRRQHGIGPYVLDFYCPMLRLAIELDGSVHNEAWRTDYDMARDEFLRGQGISVMHFTNEVVWQNSEGIVEAIVAFGKEKRKRL
jgi:very-short-patch-repair endonuclease